MHDVQYGRRSATHQRLANIVKFSCSTCSRVLLAAAHTAALVRKLSALCGGSFTGPARCRPPSRGKGLWYQSGSAVEAVMPQGKQHSPRHDSRMAAW